MESVAGAGAMAKAVRGLMKMKCSEGKQSSRISKAGSFPGVCIFALAPCGSRHLVCSSISGKLQMVYGLTSSCGARQCICVNKEEPCFSTKRHLNHQCCCPQSLLMGQGKLWDHHSPVDSLVLAQGHIPSTSLSGGRCLINSSSSKSPS